MDKGPQWEALANNSECTPSLTSDDAQFLADIHTSVKQGPLLPVLQKIITTPLVSEEFVEVAKHQIFNVAGDSLLYL